MYNDRFYICYSSIEMVLTTIKLRTKLHHSEGSEKHSKASHTPHHAYENGLVSCWLVIQLINNDEVPYGDYWRHQTENFLIQVIGDDVS
jgi:hypothetical protein